MGSAAVILGLTTTILATMGNSVEEISTLVVVGRRPILGLILAAGAPAVAPVFFFRVSESMGPFGREAIPATSKEGFS